MRGGGGGKIFFVLDSLRGHSHHDDEMKPRGRFDGIPWNPRENKAVPLLGIHVSGNESFKEFPRK